MPAKSVLQANELHFIALNCDMSTELKNHRQYLLFTYKTSPEAVGLILNL